ncbi:MAG: hypothetical protein HOP29_13375 [Phycisphaerales bacterium]|nr:hypothetical protein [Phycisphaerales bacterium]
MPRRHRLFPWTIIALALAGVWITAAVWATWSIRAAGDNPFPAASNWSAVSLAALLISCVGFIVQPASPSASTGSAEFVSAIVFAVVSAALIADTGITPMDAMAALLTLVGVSLIRHPALWWPAIVALALAAGLSPLAAIPAALVVTMPVPNPRRLASLTFIAAIVVLTWTFLPPVDRSWLGMPSIAPSLQRIGPAYLWTLHAEWGNRVAPAFALAALAAAERWRFRTELDDNWTTARHRILLAWLIGAWVTATLMPRVAISRGLLLVLPAFLLVAPGCRVFRMLPMDRRHASLSAFTIMAAALLLFLLWQPFAATFDLLMVAAFDQ